MRSRISLWFGGLVVAAALVLSLDAQAAPDAWVTAKVKMALIAAEGVPGAGVSVDTTDGRVTLYGDVATQAEKSRAAEIASGIEGARSVRNLLVVSDARRDEPARVTDAELKREVERAFREDHALAGTRIEVRSVQDGVVTLAGRAGSFSENRRAIGTAAGVLGVRRVESEVDAPDLTDAEIGRDEPFDATEYAKATASDMWITTAVKTRLLADDATPGLDINVDTEDGRVTLFGTVGSDAARRRAAEEARKVGGVREVENVLQVVPPASQAVVERVDADIAAEVERRIAERPELRGDPIDVQVENAVVRLTGSIDGAGDRLAALTAARGVTGVTKVIDGLQVEPPQVGAR